MNVWEHYHNGKFYAIVNTNAETQENNIWVPAYQYISLSDATSKIYTRSVDEFKRKFTNVNLIKVE